MKETERAEKYYEELETKPEFIKLTHTGISTDYDVIFKFATDFNSQENKDMNDVVLRNLKLEGENKELREIILRDLLESMDGTHPEYHYEIVEEALKEHLNNKP